ncbi:MAG: epoxyqueuosine reductase [Kiritimatiellae bacterium]|nr:epoxyqueuosine reductase [Kiritimatiellia bacterium]
MSSESIAPLTQEVKDLAKRHGAALVGVAGVDRFDPMPPLHDAAPPGHHPRDFIPGARSVISIAQPILSGVMDAPAVLAEADLPMIPPHVRRPYFDRIYGRVGHFVQDCMLEFVGQIVGQYLMSRGYQAMIFPTTGVHPSLPGLTDGEIWGGPPKGVAQTFSPFRYTFGPFSHRHAATRAGLGEFGYNNLVLTPEFGPRVRFNSIVTDAELAPDPLITRPICLRRKCKLCIKACVTATISTRDDPDVQDYRSVDAIDDARIFIDTPSKSDAPRCMRRPYERPDFPIRGDCMRICPIPKKPKRLPKHLQRLLKQGDCGWASP